MADELNEAMQEEIYNDLYLELGSEDDFNSDILKSKIKSAYKEVKRERRYPKSYSIEQIEEDMETYYTNVKNIALYDYNKIGAEGERSHSENGIARTYIERNLLFAGIVPLSII